MRRICLIKQPFGLGDILFCQKIATNFLNLQYEVIWPIADSYFDAVKKHVLNPGVIFCRESDNFTGQHMLEAHITAPQFYQTSDSVLLLIPLQCAYHVFQNESCMKAKYEMVDINWKDWSKYFDIRRDLNRENELFAELGLAESEEFVLINSWFGTPPLHKKKEIKVKTSLKKVSLEILPGYCLFDWCKVIEYASAIYSVDTSINYVIDKLTLKTKELFLYSRFNPANWLHVGDIFSTPWRLM